MKACLFCTLLIGFFLPSQNAGVNRRIIWGMFICSLHCSSRKLILIIWLLRPDVQNQLSGIFLLGLSSMHQNILLCSVTKGCFDLSAAAVPVICFLTHSYFCFVFICSHQIASRRSTRWSTAVIDP